MPGHQPAVPPALRAAAAASPGFPWPPPAPLPSGTCWAACREGQATGAGIGVRGSPPVPAGPRRDPGVPTAPPHLEETRMRRRFRYFWDSVSVPGDKEGGQGVAGCDIPGRATPCQAVPGRTLLPLAVVGTESLVAGSVGVQVLEGVLGNVLLHHHLVVADDVGQRQRHQLRGRVGIHGVESGGSCGVGGTAGVSGAGGGLGAAPRGRGKGR